MIGWSFKWLKDVDSGEGRKDTTKGKVAARNTVEGGRCLHEEYSTFAIEMNCIGRCRSDY